MRKLRDPMFLLTLFAAIAAIVVPIWIWRSDLSSRSLHFRLAAQTALQPEEKNVVKGLKISVDGLELESPFLSVIELINDGTRPIPSSDFESPIELHLESKSFIARANVTATSPQGLAAELVVDRQSVRLKPLLLNSRDVVTIAIITSGEPPKFSSRARISGVTEVRLEDATKVSKLGSLRGLLVIAGFLFAVCYWMASDGLMRKSVLLRPRAATLVIVLSGFGGGICIVLFFDAIDVRETWQVIVGGLGIALAAHAGASWLNRSLGEPPNEDASNGKLN